jgi:Holliday junction resolvasome RuvABC endonuclease subunit
VRLNLIRARCLTVSQAWAQHFPPVAVYVERPTGKHASPILTMAAGATLMGFSDGLADVFDHPVRAFLCAVSEWKKPVIGNGNASKELVMAWARGRGYDGDRQDAADALAIAHFGAAECAVWGFEERKVA